MTKEQAVKLLTSLVRGTKLTEDERGLCYSALQFLSDLDKKEEAPKTE